MEFLRDSCSLKKTLEQLVAKRVPLLLSNCFVRLVENLQRSGRVNLARATVSCEWFNSRVLKVPRRHRVPDSFISSKVLVYYGLFGFQYFIVLCAHNDPPYIYVTFNHALYHPRGAHRTCLSCLTSVSPGGTWMYRPYCTKSYTQECTSSYWHDRSRIANTVTKQRRTLMTL